MDQDNDDFLKELANSSESNRRKTEEERQIMGAFSEYVGKSAVYMDIKEGKETEQSEIKKFLKVEVVAAGFIRLSWERETDGEKNVFFGLKDYRLEMVGDEKKEILMVMSKSGKGGMMFVFEKG